jgi:hypothetical protein
LRDVGRRFAQFLFHRNWATVTKPSERYIQGALVGAQLFRSRH